VAGGLLFSLPLLYTMEVWHAGFAMPPQRQLIYVLLALVLLLGYNRYAGLHPDSTWAEVAIDSIEEMGIGLLVSAGALLLLGRLTAGQHLSEVVGRIVVEAVTVAIGVSVGTAQLGTRKGDEKPGLSRPKREVSFGGQLTLAVCGAVLFAANVAPTEEIVVIGIELPGFQLALLGVASMVLGGLILFYSDFRGTRRVRPDGFGGVLRGTVITYAVGLVTSAAILWLFGRFQGEGLLPIVGQTVALAVASTLGASAGRLLLQGAQNG
jgi:putative integral membrane protein (TIGR02587 family)